MQQYIPEFLELIYDSVSDPRGWEAFSKRMMEVLGADFSHTLITDFQSPSHNYGALVSRETGNVKAYEKVVFNEENLKLVLDQQPEVSAFLAKDFLAQVSGSGFSVEDIFLFPDNSSNFIASFIRTRQDPAYSVLHIYGRPANHDWFSREHLDFLMILAGHIKKAYSLSININHTTELNSFIARTLNHVAAGVFIISYRGGVLSMNKLAENYIEDGAFRVEGKKLVVNAEGATKMLDDALERIASSNQPSGEYVQYTDREGKKFFLSCLPHTESKGAINREWRLSDGAQYVVFVTDEKSSIDLPWETLKTLYGLTESESKVVRMLVNGSSTEDIAIELSINANSVRYHLKNCFSKTFVNNQAELVGLILRTLGNLPHLK